MKVYFKSDDVKVIAYYTGFVTVITAGLMAIPIFISLIFAEWQMLFNFMISIGIAITLGAGGMKIGRAHKTTVKIQWKHGLVISATSWLVLMLLCAMPYYLSGHYLSYLDAIFDVMSGFTTTGLTLAQDLDHMSISLNIWRHIITFVGGQGMVVLALSFLFKHTHGAYKIYVGEAKDIELVPNVKGTARIIWGISLAYLIVGTGVYFVDGVASTGLNPVNALVHGFCLFASAWSTGGFAPMSQNVLFYHSFSNEIIGIVLFILGSLNFGLHYAIWNGKRREIYKNIEMQSFAVTVGTMTLLLVMWLSNNGIYNDAVAMFRKGIYHLLSAHTTTGFGTLYARQFVDDWGDFGILILIVAMLIGGSACSTAGGIKGLRVGILFKSLIADVKRSLRPERRITIEKYHHIKDIVIDDASVRSTATIIICYVCMFLIGTALGSFYGYPMTESAFEAASVTGNVGLSIGITTASMPMGLKVYYIFAMFLGRLEFMSVFALIGIIISGVSGLWKR